MSEKQAACTAHDATNRTNDSEPSEAPQSYNPTSDAQTTGSPTHCLPYDFKSYSAEDAQLSEDRTTVTIHSDSLTSDPVALEAFIAHQLTLPPRPTVQLTATRWNSNAKRMDIIFDLQLDLLRHVAPATPQHPGWAYVKSTGTTNNVQIPLDQIGEERLSSKQPDPLGAAFAFRRFCSSSSRAKRFVLTRSVSNWDTDYIKERLTFLIQPLCRPGVKLQITFPTQYSVVHIQPASKNNAFVTGIQNLFTNPEIHEPLTVVWPFATAPRSGISGLDTKTREVLVQNEDEWLDEWKDAIIAAMAGRKKGWLGDSDKMDAAMLSSKQVSDMLHRIMR